MKKSVTLLELIIAFTLFSVVILAFSSLDLFTRYHVIGSDRRAKLQNDISYILEHMTKEIRRAIGNEVINGADSVIEVDVKPNDVLVKVYIDASGNGMRETPVNNPAAAEDHWIAYRYDSTGAPMNQVRYCGRCNNANCNFASCMDAVDILSRNVADFTAIKPVVNPGTDNTLNDNSLDVEVTCRWQAAQAASADNPAVTMRSRIKMPSVSLH